MGKHALLGNVKKGAMRNRGGSSVVLSDTKKINSLGSGHFLLEAINCT
jgi:hypothetical protein